MRTRSGPIVIAALAAALGYPGQAESQEPAEFEEADIYAELNDTDGDLGLHALIDGDAWRRLQIEAPDGRNILDVTVKRRLRRQGLTEFFFESAEPTFDELSAERFFRRFSEGEYVISGVTVDGEMMESTDRFRRVMPAPAGNIMVAGEPAAEDCDAALPVVSDMPDPVLVDWDPVTTSHPDIGRPDQIEIARYEFVVEFEFEEDGDEKVLVFMVDLPPDQTEMVIPASFTALADETFDVFKIEILAIEEDGNRTAVETCFVLSPV